MKKLTIVQVAVVIFASIILLTWFKSDKLASYWQQEHESSEPFETIADSGVGKVGNKVGELGADNQIAEDLQAVNKPFNETANKLLYQEALAKEQLLKEEKKRAMLEAKLKAQLQKQTLLQSQQQTQLETQQPLDTKSQDELLATQTKGIARIHLEDGKKALFIGDSLMQGVAPWVMRKLQNDHQIKSINLSKHSTGLTVSKFFDWPATLEKTLAENPDVNVLFVFLGGNDGQSIIDPNTKRHVRFASERWDEIYVGKIQRILDTANANNVQVLWVAPPNMKSPALNKKTAHLSSLYSNHVADSRALMLYSKEILQLDTAKDKYSDSMLINGKLTKVRTADGVHFTVRGQKVLANAIMDKLDVNGNPMLSTTEVY